MRITNLAIGVTAWAAGKVLASTCLVASAIVLSNPDHQWAFAYYGSPMWHFGGIKANGQTYRTCYPTWPRRPDGSKRPSVSHNGGMTSLANGCTNQPGADGWGTNFPVFYNVRQCSGSGYNEIRVSYSLFWEKDGESIYGHDYDWENVVVVWRQYSSSGTLLWCKNELVMSQHSIHQAVRPWNQIKQTVDIGNWFESNAKDKDIPKIYSGICKHANYQEAKEDQAKDPSGIPVIEDNLIRSGYDTEYGQWFINNDWGSASSKPTNVWNDMCGYSAHKKRGMEEGDEVYEVVGNYTVGVADAVTGINITTFVFDEMTILE
ncbi:hypothetical protein BKA64DRAFT_714730 [Cadophora sp. MPI-SDFR-AT-0126]|nr:hypothetical protein BKA64DRAFT_714730 [Leotiomycetes sp. MPI-SDFR-AT-0126]